MNHIEKVKERVKRALQIAPVGLALVALTACGGVATMPEAELGNQTVVRYDYSLSVEVRPQDSQAEIESRYGGDAVVWRPEAGFAVIGIQSGELTTLSADAEANQDAFSIPSATIDAQGWGAWSGGWGAWSGGWGAWSGGWGAWSGGWGAWSGGTNTGETTTFGENLPSWQQIKLAEGQSLAPNMGKGVKVAVIDSGVDVNHPALQGKLAPASEWKDFIDGDAYPFDEYDNTPGANNKGYGHGTGVAGVVLQVAPEATILPIRVLKPDGSGDITDVARAVDHAVQQGADVINLSLGAYVDSATIYYTMAYGAQYDVYFTASSGNSGDDRVTYPALMAPDAVPGDLGILGRNLVSVGSVDADSNRSVFSTYGSTIELAAPGEFVHTIAPWSEVAYHTGTSFAAPMAAGTLALALGELGDNYDGNLAMMVHQEDDYRGWDKPGQLNVEKFMKRALQATR